MMNKDDFIAYIQKQQWFADLVDERAHQLIDELMHDDETANPSVAVMNALPKTGSTVVPERGDSTLTDDERMRINTWLRENGDPKRSFRAHIRKDLIAQYFVQHPDEIGG